MMRLCDRRGTTAIEFAVSITLVLMLVFSMIDIGLLYLAQQTLNYGVSAASRWAVVNSTSANATNVASQFVAAATPGLGAARAAPTNRVVSFAPSSTPGGSVTVQATLAWSPLTNFDFLAAATLSSSQTLVIQH
jgi:Flp pilus assembly protein TadG